MQIQVMCAHDTKDIASELLTENSRIKLLDAQKLRAYRWEDFRLFCHFHGRYGVPTIEQNLFLKKIIGERSAIEIGAGAGDLGFHLQIPMTDSKMQDNPKIKKMYEGMRQPTIVYGTDVEKLDALEAVKKYKPQVVIASWVTTYAPQQMPYGSNPYGVKEDLIFKEIETFILIGNKDSHGDKPIMKIPHEEINEPWIVSRAQYQYNNRIWIWNIT